MSMVPGIKPIRLLQCGAIATGTWRRPSRALTCTIRQERVLRNFSETETCRYRICNKASNAYFFDNVLEFALFQLHLHSGDFSEVQKYLPKECLPSDFGGELKSVAEFHGVTTDNKMPSTDSELNEYVKRDGEPESRLKRTLSFTRNALNRKRSRKDPPMIIGEMEGQDAKMKKQFLRPSLNKFLNKVVQKMSNLGLQNNKNACSSYMMYGSRRQNNLNTSLSSNDIRVPPVRPGNFPGDKVPGVIGLRNHGNTCFINAVLQCLSHTDILAEYFVLDQYKADLSRRNKLNSKKHGTKGEVTQHLALLLKSIWSCQYDPEISNKFKSVVDKYGSQFRGNNQHDAQEFLLWLLDKVHEDLNTATKKKYKAIKVPLTFSSMKSTWFWVHSVDVCLTT
ncbi:unnamed protein product [Nesidiocoris tenuis]|uniref:ubiquitinyl hydrolase 1 n=1 Tax=Nesidiocoris tenuis TaxID=355587 RepID=A0A6H5HFV9_9HEMI|nr:unnamed protein product [Nesidiocoris tenuis]